MSTFVTSKGTRAQHVSPRSETRPYRMAPWTREHIYKNVRPMVDEQPRWWRVVSVVVMVVTTVYALKLAVVG